MYNKVAAAPTSGQDGFQSPVTIAEPSSSPKGKGLSRVIPENPAGLSENVNDLAETPDQMLKRTLLPNEEVIATFDCFFPTFMLPRWKIVALLTMTLGLYAFVLLFRAIQRWCYKNNFCTPKVVNFQRGKVAVTTKGRLVCWSVDFNQHKVERGCLKGLLLKACCFCFGRSCDPAVLYHGKIETRIYNSNSLRQVSQNYNSASALGFLCWCCCIEYTCSVELAFDEFDHAGLQVGCVATSPNLSYFNALAQGVQATLSTLEIRLGLGSDKVLYIYSKTEDMVHNGDVKATIEDMNTLYSNLIGILPRQEDVFVANDELVKENTTKVNFMKDFLGKQIIADNGTFIKNSLCTNSIVCQL